MSCSQLGILDIAVTLYDAIRRNNAFLNCTTVTKYILNLLASDLNIVEDDRLGDFRLFAYGDLVANETTINSDTRSQFDVISYKLRELG